MTKTISNDGIKLVCKLEGCILHAYKDIANVPTIGVGHTGGVYMGQTITQAQADELLRKDLKEFVDAVNSLVKVPVNQNQFDALVIFAFNVGKQGLAKSTLLKKLNAGDYKGAAEQFDVWTKITDPDTGRKVVSQGLVNRRNAEQALFLKPVPVVPFKSIKKGSTDKEKVKQIQRKLNIKVDGIFGNGTYMAVRNFQTWHNLEVDGVVGKNTWNKMF